MNLLVSPLAWIVVLVLAALGLAGSLPSYHLGRKGNIPAIQERFPRVPEERWEQFEGLFERWGALILLLTALPGFGMIIPPAAGVHGIKPISFLIMVGIAKLIRFWVIVLLLFGSVRALQIWLGS